MIQEKKDIQIVEHPQYAVALGAALIAMQTFNREKNKTEITHKKIQVN